MGMPVAGRTAERVIFDPRYWTTRVCLVSRTQAMVFRLQVRVKGLGLLRTSLRV